MSPSLQTMGFFMSDINFCNTKEQLNHLGEVVTGKVDGSPTGADIDTSTLPYTGQVRKTLSALEEEYQADIDNFVQVSDQLIIDKTAEFDTSIANKEAEADVAIDSYRLLNKGPYSSGITLESKFEYITYSGESYFAINPPYTTTATTPDADGNLFVGGYVNESLATQIAETVLEENVSKYTDIVYKSSVSGSSIENMIEAFNLNPLVHAVGTILSTGGTNWEYIDSTGAITIENFRAFDVINILDCGAKGDGSDDGDAIRYGFELMHQLNKSLFFPAPSALYSIQTADPSNPNYALVLPDTPQGERAISIIGEVVNTEIKLEVPSAIQCMMYWSGGSYGRAIKNLYFNANNLAEKVWDATEAYHPYLNVVECSFYRATEVCSDVATFQSSFTRVTNAWSKKGFNFTGPGASRLITSLSMNTCYAVNCTEYGFWFDELTYCSFNALACDNSGVAYYVDISRGVSFNGCGAESSNKIMEIRASQGTAVNGMFGLNMGDASTPVANLIQIETGESFSISGLHIAGSDGQYDKKLELLTGSFQSACVTVLDSSISPSQARWVPNVTYDKPIKFVVFDATNKARTISTSTYQDLVSELEILSETTILHNTTYQLPDGDFFVNDLNLTEVAGSGNITFKGGTSTRLVIQDGQAFNASNYNGSIVFEDLDIELQGTTVQAAVNFYNCKNVVFNTVNVSGVDVNSRRINLSGSRLFMNNSFSNVNWITSGDWDISVPRAGGAPASGEWPTAMRAYDQFPSASRVGWARTSSQTWVEF